MSVLGVLTGAGLITAWVIARGRGKSSKKKGGNGAHRSPWPTPLLWDPARLEVDATREICRLGPLVADDRLAGSVWASLFPSIAWPILEADHESVRSAGLLVGELVGEYLVAPSTFCLEPEPGPLPRPNPIPVGPGPVIPPAPIAVEELEDVYPTPGRFYQVRQGDFFNGTNPDHSIVYRALLSAGYLAAKNLGGFDDEAASAYARSVANNSAARAIYRKMILCVPFNDENYSTYGYGPNAAVGPHGRGIRLVPVHADNRARLADGLPAMRLITLGKPSDEGNLLHTGSGDDYEYLWLPALNLSKLWAGGSWDDRITSDGVTWEDGSSQFNPPPEVHTATQLLPAGVSWGCANG